MWTFLNICVAQKGFEAKSVNTFHRHRRRRRLVDLCHE